MNYIEHLNLFGVEAKEIPCIRGNGAPTSEMAVTAGLMYMDVNNGNIYKSVASGEWIKTVGTTVISSINLLKNIDYTEESINVEGVISTSSWLALTGFFDVEPNKKIIATYMPNSTRVGLPTFRVAFYNENEEFIGIKSAPTASEMFSEFETPDGCKKIRMCVQKAAYIASAKPMLYYGDSIVADRDHYQPYIPPFTAISNSDFRNKTLCVFGDSLAADGYHGSLTWGEIVARYLGFSKFYNRGIGGSRVCDIDGVQYAYVDDEGYAYYRRMYTSAQTVSGYTEIDSAMEHQDRINCIPEDTDVLLIEAGVNDFLATTNVSAELTETFRTAYKNMLSRIQIRIPSAKIVICNCPYYHNGDSNYTENMEKHREVIREAAQEYGFPIIELRRLMGVNANNYSETMDSDGLHYTNVTGRTKFAETVISGLKSITFVNQS